MGRKTKPLEPVRSPKPDPRPRIELEDGWPADGPAGGAPKRPAPAASRPAGKHKPKPVKPGQFRRPGKPGRPSFAELAQLEAERRELEKLTPDLAKPMVGTILTALCLAAKGEPPLPQEVDTVTPPACAVANKYAVSSRWAPEIALIGSVALVLQNSRARRRARGPKPEKPAAVDRSTAPIQPKPERAPDVEAIASAGKVGAS